MFVIEGLLSGVIAGAIMILVNEIGYRLNILKGNMIMVDGSFALKRLDRGTGRTMVYIAGIVVHLATSAVFGIVYVCIAYLLGFDSRLPFAVALYVFILWLAMLFTALPAAGQGILGKRIGRFIWIEQIALHIVFGFAFWWALGII
jgi:Na+/H+-dicarboxylate symporter